MGKGRASGNNRNVRGGRTKGNILDKIKSGIGSVISRGRGLVTGFFGGKKGGGGRPGGGRPVQKTRKSRQRRKRG